MQMPSRLSVPGNDGLIETAIMCTNNRDLSRHWCCGLCAETLGESAKEVDVHQSNINVKRTDMLIN